jgi:hypothetical protein
MTAVGGTAPPTTSGPARWPLSRAGTPWPGSLAAGEVKQVGGYVGAPDLVIPDSTEHGEPKAGAG